MLTVRSFSTTNVTLSANPGTAAPSADGSRAGAAIGKLAETTVVGVTSQVMVVVEAGEGAATSSGGVATPKTQPSAKAATAIAMAVTPTARGAFLSRGKVCDVANSASTRTLPSAIAPPGVSPTLNGLPALGLGGAPGMPDGPARDRPPTQ